MTTIFLLAFVMPRFTAIYASKGAMLPAPTRLLMASSALVTGHWPALLVGLAILLAAGWVFLQSTPGRRLWHSVQLHVPLLGPMYRKLHLARGIRMIGTMACAGVNLIDCVTVANDLCANSYFRELWEDVLHKIQAGKQMSEPLSQSPLVPRSVTQMIHSGEKSGRLAQVMEQVAGFSDQELKEKIAEVTRYIEPAMIVLMGALIGGVAMALMLPIFTIGRVVGH
jgi:type IV pilus assembly protein PilC